MGGTKFMVIQLKNLIKNVIFTIIGIILIVMLVYFFIPRGEGRAQVIYDPGTYSSSILLNNEPVDVVVTVTEREITSIELQNMEEIQQVFYPLVAPTLATIAEEIVKNQSLDVSIPAQSEITGNMLLQAVGSAIEQAKL